MKAQSTFFVLILAILFTGCKSDEKKKETTKDDTIKVIDSIVVDTKTDPNTKEYIPSDDEIRE